MNKKAISLCIILFIMIMCTTVNASDISVTDNVTNITDNSVNDTIITSTVDVEVQSNVQTPASQDYTISNETISKMELNNEKQDVQTNAHDDLIVKQYSSTVKADTETIQNLTGLNITGVVSIGYNRTNRTYAPDESEGFAVQGAKITLYDSQENEIATTESDKDGKYQFLNVTKDDYLIKFEYGTYKEEIREVDWENDWGNDHIFIPDLVIISFSGDSKGSGQSEKINYLLQLSDRFLFIESYALNSSYDKTGQWMIENAEFILVDMYSTGNGFGVKEDLIARSEASRNKRIAYTFGLFDTAIFTGPLNKWGILGTDPNNQNSYYGQSVENTYIGSYWQTLSITNSPILRKNMENMYAYIRYLLKETDVNPTTTGNGPLLLSNSWGLYYPGFENDVKTPSGDLINHWITTNPGYNADHAGSLNWMTENYAQWNLEHNDPIKIFRTFEDWYDTNKKEYTSPFIVISTYYEGGEVVDALIKEYEKQGRAVFSIYKVTSEDPDMTALLELAGNRSIIKRGVSAVSYMYWWTTGYAQRGGDYTIKAYKNLNVSLINALKDISQFSFESQYGPQNEWTAAVTMPQFEGVFGALPISYIDENKTTVIIPEGITKHVQLTNGWAKLRELNNSDKKVSVLVYGYPPGKANIGASFLDVFQSIHDLFEHFYDEGYDIGMNRSDIPTTEQLNAIISDFSNKGLWAEGLLDTYVISNYDTLTKWGQLVSKQQYFEWYNALPEALQEHVIQSWGEGLGNGSMIYREKAEINKSNLEKWLGEQSDIFQDEFKHYWNDTDRNIIISEDSEVMLVNKTEFYKFIFDLPANLQKTFNDSVGSRVLDESNYRDEGYYVIPGVHFGNIFLSVQPMRGWESQMDFHTSDLSPPQQYIAYYKYLSDVYKTDAIMHMGTHGTLEWLPGRSLGLQATDWPFQLTSTPIIYPYIVSNPGEGMTAKERSFAQVLTHLTPVTAATSLYGDYVELNDAISRYDSNKKAGVVDNLDYYQNLILNITESLGYDLPDYMVVTEALKDYYIALDTENESTIYHAKHKLILEADKLSQFEFNRTSDGSYQLLHWRLNMTNFDEDLPKLEEYLNHTDELFDQWLAQIHDDIEAMSADKINFGMHTLGKVWNDTDMITGVTSIVSSRTEVLDHIMHMYYPEITGSYFDKIKERDFNDQKTLITGVLKNIITSLVEGSTIDEISEMYGVFNKSSDFYQDLILIEDTINRILDNKEWEYIFTALSGGYVEPALSADPLYSDVLPTGGSMYASDTSKIPSKSAWYAAVNSVNKILDKYQDDMGQIGFPQLVGEVIWGTEVLRTEGISIAQFLYLLGVRPVWDQTGTVTGVEVIPMDELRQMYHADMVYNRPRIDVFATIVTNNPDWIALMTKAVEMVNALNETQDNYVKLHYNKTGSLQRLYGLPGAVLEGTGVSDYLNNAATQLTENNTGISEDLADIYETRIGHSWNVDNEGNIVVDDDREGLTYLLKNVQLVIQNLDSTWRYLDSDDYVDWYGGLLNAANVHGALVNTVLLDIRDKNNIVLSTLGEEVKRETRTTILNPQWLGAMTTDVGGWNQMSMNFENLMKTMLTTQKYQENQNGRAVFNTTSGNNAGIVGNGLLREIAKTVTYSEYFQVDAQYKSYAVQSMIGYLLTADMAKYWETKDNTLRKDLLQKYVDNANRYGVACCHHTCGNINFHDWVLKVGAALGVQGLSEYAHVYASATKNPDAANVPGQSNTPSTTGSDSTGTVDISEGISEYLNDGSRGESNAFARASAGASGFSGSSSMTGAAKTMTKTNNGGSGSGANTDAQSGDGNNGGNNGTGSGSDSSSGNSTNGTGNGTGTSDAQGNSTNVEGNGTSTNSTANSTTEVDTNSTLPETPDVKNDTEVVEPVENTTTPEVPDVKNDTEVVEPVENTTTPEVPDVKNDTEVVEPVENTTEVIVPVPTQNDTKVNDTEQNITNPSDEPQQQVQNSTEETKSGAGDEPDTPDSPETPDTPEIPDTPDSPETPDTPDSPDTPDTPADSQPSSTLSPDSGDVALTGITVTSGSATSGGDSGTTAGAVAMYEVVKKNIGQPATPQSEISIGYLLFIIGLLLIFFFGFTRPNNRS